MRGLSFFTAKRGGGVARKTKYETNVLPNLHRIPAWRKQGMTTDEVAKKLKIGKTTLYHYVEKYPELSNALKKGKEELIEELEDSLYKRAFGMEVKESKEYVVVDAEGGTTQKKEIFKKYIPPDVGALAFALKNLDSHRWNDRRRAEESDKEKDLKIKKLEAEVEQLKTKNDLLKGIGHEIEDLSEIESDIYGD